MFCRRPDTSNYIAKLLKKKKFLYNNIENMNNKKLYYKDFICELTNYIQIQELFLSLIIVDAIIIVFYKTIQQSKLFFTIAILNFFSFFHLKILAFLFAIVYCGKNKYQDSEKVIIPFNGKTAQSIYFFLNQDWFDTLNNRCVRIDNWIVVLPLTRTKKSDLFKT